MRKRMAFPFIVILLVSVITTILAVPVFAYTYSGHYWDGYYLPSPLYVYVEDDVADVCWVAWYSGFTRWNDATNSPTNFSYTEDPYYKDIDCLYADYSSLGWTCHSQLLQVS